MAQPKTRKSRSKPKYVGQFLIVLPGTDPRVWRRILVPEAYSFWDLHVAIRTRWAGSIATITSSRSSASGPGPSSRVGARPRLRVPSLPRGRQRLPTRGGRRHEGLGSVPAHHPEPTDTDVRSASPHAHGAGRSTEYTSGCRQRSRSRDPTGSSSTPTRWESHPTSTFGVIAASRSSGSVPWRSRDRSASQPGTPGSKR